MTQIDEKWIEIPKVQNQKNAIIAISSTGKYRKLDGTVGCLELRQRIRYCGKLEYCYRVIAENFLITVRRPDQVFIDHITHTRTEYKVNDVRNLRWCTPKENSNFEEAKDNQSCENNPNWKGNDVEAAGAYRRALKQYNDGNITEEEFQPYRDGWAEYRRQRKIAKKTSSPI